MNSTKPKDLFSNSAALPVSHPTLNDTSNQDNELIIGLEDWSQDLFGEGLDFSSEVTSSLAGDHNSSELVIIQEDKSPQRDHIDFISNQFGNSKLHLELHRSNTDQEDGAFTIQKEKDSSSLPEGREKMIQTEEASSTHTQIQCSPTDLPQVDFNYFDNDWKVENAPLVDLDQFFPQGRGDSTLPDTSNDAAILQSVPQRGVTMPPLTEHPRVLGGQRQLPGNRMQPPARPISPSPSGMKQRPLVGNRIQPLARPQPPVRPINPSLTRPGQRSLPGNTRQPPARPINSSVPVMGQRLLLGNRIQPPARPFNPSLIGVKQQSLPGNTGQLPARPINSSVSGMEQWPLLYRSGTQPPANQILTRTIQQPSRSTKPALFKTRPPLFGIMEPVKGAIGPLKWEWRQLPETIYGTVRSTRWDKIKQFDPKLFYVPITRIPQSFGRHELGDLPPFRYNSFGELLTKKKFTPAQIYEYLAYHPLHYSKSGYDPKSSKLILWIQNIPSDSSNRYPNNLSDKCRFSGCPAPNHTIFKGFFRVAFDEHSTERPFVDPFHCAAFVHLYCLEKFCDFPSICRTFNVQADVRELPEGINKMSITRDYYEMKEVVDNFIASAANKPKSRRYEESLGYLLTMQILKLEPKVRKVRRRESCFGNTIGDHHGNLIRWVDAGGINGLGEPSYQESNVRATNKRHHSVSVDENNEENANAKKQRLEIEQDIQEPRWKIVKVPKRKRDANSGLRLELEELKVEPKDRQNISETVKRRKTFQDANC